MIVIILPIVSFVNIFSEISFNYHILKTGQIYIILFKRVAGIVVGWLTKPPLKTNGGFIL